MRAGVTYRAKVRGDRGLGLEIVWKHGYLSFTPVLQPGVNELAPPPQPFQTVSRSSVPNQRVGKPSKRLTESLGAAGRWAKATARMRVLFLSGSHLQSPGADSLSNDEAAIALYIKALHNENSEAREAAAEALRRIIAKYASGTSNIRSKDSGEAYWMEKVSQVKEGMTKTEVGKIHPPLSESAEEITPNGDVSYRIDSDWVVTIPYHHSDKAKSSAKLTKSEFLVFVSPPKNYTGTWITWYVNGQRSHEIQYENGGYNGVLTAYHDNGQRSYEQHYTNHVCDGPDTGWYRSGLRMYSGQYRNGKQDGKWMHWFANGEKQSEETFTDGEFDGLIAGWYENGQMRFEKNYKNGEQDGVEAGWNEQGVLQYRREY